MQEAIKFLNNISRGTLTEIHIADIHFGAIDPKLQYNILKEQFIDKIVNIPFDILSINGDLFDHKFMSNSDVIMYACLFINNLVEICKNKNATFVMIAGTYHHDAGQLKLFYHYIQDPSIDIRIVEEARFEYIKGAKILCIPELYNMGADYYNNLLWNNGTYDAVFMHGAIEGSIYQAKNQESGINSDKAPIFKIEDFGLCTGFIVSGHVHTSGCYNKYFYHCGSPIRWKFGEEADKGFCIILHNLDTQEHYFHFEVIESFRYDTINLDDMIEQDPKTVIEYINQLQANGIDNIRVIFSKEDLSDAILSNINIINDFYKNNNSIKIQFKDRNRCRDTDQINTFLEENKEYEFIMDKSLSEYEILTQYINLQKGYAYITTEELKKIIMEEI